MVWKQVDKETLVETRFAIFPKKIGSYIIWLEKYYRTWDYSYDGIYTCYMPHYFISKEKALNHVEAKKKVEYGYDH
jgi:hypothetical protein